MHHPTSPNHAWTGIGFQIGAEWNLSCCETMEPAIEGKRNMLAGLIDTIAVAWASVREELPLRLH